MQSILIGLLCLLPSLQDNKKQTQEQEPIYTAESVWIEVSPEDAGASVQMPATPRTAKLEMDKVVAGEVIYLHQNSLTFNRGSANMVFAFHDIHNPIRDFRHKKRILDSAVAGTKARIYGTILQLKSVRDKKRNYGRDFVQIAKIQDINYKMATRIWLVGQRQYQMNVIMTSDKYDPAIVQKFFDSFTLIKKESDLPPKPRKLNSK